MSFTSMDGIMTLIEDVLQSCWPSEESTIKTPFPKMSYHDAINNYGTDKPDTRYDMKVSSLN